MTTDVLALNALAPGKDLDAYVQTISVFPILTPEEEKVLAERFYYDNDLEAARELVLCHLRFVVHLANGSIQRWVCGWCLLRCTGSRPRCTSSF